MTTPSTPRAQQPGPSHIVTAVQTGLTYDVGQLSPKSLTNARDGLSDNRMSMVRCYEHGNSFHFELQERVRVTIHDKQVPTCSTCPDDEGRACRHIWWVDDQILSTAVGPEARSQHQYQISHGGHAVREPKNKETLMFYNWLKEKNLEKLARRAGWWKQDPANQQDTRLVEHTATHILSVFEPCGVLPKQHGQENFEMLQRESQALFARYKDEMIRQVKSQPFLLVALGSAVPEAERDHLHLTKIHSRIERIFFDYGHWMATRTPDYSTLDATAEALSIETRHLDSFVREHKPMAENMQVRIAGILLYTLEQLAQYAGDIQTTAVVSIPQYSGLGLQDRSLLHKLINPGSPNVFVLPVLKLLDTKVLQMETIQHRAEALASTLRDGNEPCPEIYVEWLEKLVGLDE